MKGFITSLQKWTYTTKVRVQLRHNWKHCSSVLYHLNRPCRFHFQCIFIDSFCDEAFSVSGSYMNLTWMSKFVSQSTTFILQMHPSNGVHKNMLEAWNNIKINSVADHLIIICRKFSEYSLERHQTDTFESFFNSRLLLIQLTHLNFQ